MLDTFFAQGVVFG